MSIKSTQIDWSFLFSSFLTIYSNNDNDDDDNNNNTNNDNNNNNDNH